MTRVFLLTSPGSPSGAETQARLALANLPNCVSLATATPLRNGWDYAALTRIKREIADFAPDVLHAVGSKATATAGLLRWPWLGLKVRPRFLVSGCDSPAGWLAKRGLKQADMVLAYSPGEVDRYRKFVPDGQIRTLQPGVADFVPHQTSDSVPTRRMIAAVGNFDNASGLKTAIWAFDVLKYVDPCLRLLLIGDGPLRADVERFGQDLGADDCRVDYTGHRHDVPQLLASAEVVWLTHERGGMSVALEAMSAGVPVVAFRTADTESVLTPDEAGRLVPPGDRVQLASVTAGLLNRPEQCVRLGRQGRASVARFSARKLADAMAAAYDALSEHPR